MRFVRSCLVAILASLSVAVAAQTKPRQPSGSDTSLEIGLGYSYFHANAPPASCGCFSLNGGYGTFIVHINRTWRMVADLSAAHANNIDRSTQSITTFDYLFGPRYALPSYKKMIPYAQVLAGGAKEMSNSAYVQDANALGLSVGGGITSDLKHGLGWNVVEAEWVYSRLPNGVNTHQNLLRVSTGFTFSFGPR